MNAPDIAVAIPPHVAPELVREFDFKKEITGPDSYREYKKLHDLPDVYRRIIVGEIQIIFTQVMQHILSRKAGSYTVVKLKLFFLVPYSR